MGPDRSRVLVALRVPCEPAEAFEQFTAEIGQWWRPNAMFQFTEGRIGTLSFETGENSRLVETSADGTAFIIGTIRTWQPPDRLVLTWRHANFPPDRATELHVTFEPTEPAQTRVTVEHYGWDTIPARHAAATASPSRCSKSTSHNGGAPCSNWPSETMTTRQQHDRLRPMRAQTLQRPGSHDSYACSRVARNGAPGVGAVDWARSPTRWLPSARCRCRRNRDPPQRAARLADVRAAVSRRKQRLRRAA